MIHFISRVLRKVPLATAMLDGMKAYDLPTFKSDLTAGFIVSMIALPLSMALAIAVGLPPQHGLYTAIVAGTAAALFGGSSTQITGPTAAFVVIIAPIVTEHGLHGLIWCQIIAGVLLLLFGILRLGKLIRYVPYPVVVGFTAGIAVTLATIELNDLLGLRIDHLDGHYHEKVMQIATALPHINWAETSIGVATFLVIMLMPKFDPRVPSALAGILFGTVMAFFFMRNGIEIDTLLTRFSYVTPDGVKMQGIPPYPPVLHLPGQGDNPLFRIPDLAFFKALLVPAVLVTILAALETLLSAAVADTMTNKKHEPNAELNGLGIANILSGMTAGIPATGAIARTSANIQNGGKTPVSAVVHAVLLLFYMVTLSQYLGHIPMAALAGLLMTVAWRMSHFAQSLAILRVGGRRKAIVLTGCFIATVAIDMVAGVAVGMFLAVLLMRNTFRLIDEKQALSG